MKINIVLFALAREVAGTDSTSIEVPEGSKISDVADSLLTKYPGLKGVYDACSWALNQEIVNIESSLKDSDEVAVIPPMSGG